MAELREARLQVHRCRDNARKIVCEQQGPVQCEAREAATDVQMEEARYLLAAGASMCKAGYQNKGRSSSKHR